MIRKLLMPLGRWFFMERHASGKSVVTLQKELEAAAEAVADRISTGADTPDNRALAAHVIGIEAWAQQRVRVALGEALREEEYDGYRPDPSLDMSELRDAFLDVRHNSLVLAAELHDAGVDPTSTVPHNDFGDVTVGGWLAYMIGHGEFESKRIKQAETAAR